MERRQTGSMTAPIFGIQIIDDSVQFFKQLFDNFGNGLFVFGSVWDIVLLIVDVTVCSLLFYFLLKLVRETRAWQLLKGLIFIMILSQFSDLLGLQTIKFILSSTLSILAIAFVIIFQPELRRALEKVGRKTGGFFSQMGDHQPEESFIEKMAENISSACQKMAKDRCGALIIIERTTPMAELAEQRNAVLVDAAVTEMNLLQIFYEGSPMHDGAVLIRNGRIYASRCHVPLSDDTRVKDGLGTRHRAAIGASEMGDAISVVVSEERGTISFTVDGRLYSLASGESLFPLLRDQLQPKRTADEDGRDKGFWRRLFKLDYDSQERLGAIEGVPGQSETEILRRRKMLRRMKWLSVLISLLLWIYVQTTQNPIKTTTVTVPVQTTHHELLEAANLDFSKSDSVVKLEMRARAKYIGRLNTDTIFATLDFADLDMAAIKTAIADGDSLPPQKMEIHVNVHNLFKTAYEVSRRTPSTFYVSIYPAAPVTDQSAEGKGASIVPVNDQSGEQEGDQSAEGDQTGGSPDQQGEDSADGEATEESVGNLPGGMGGGETGNVLQKETLVSQEETEGSVPPSSIAKTAASEPPKKTEGTPVDIGTPLQGPLGQH